MTDDQRKHQDRYQVRYDRYKDTMGRISSILSSEPDRYCAIQKITEIFVPGYADACIVYFEQCSISKIVAVHDEKYRQKLSECYTPSEIILHEQAPAILPGLLDYKSGIEFPLWTLGQKCGVISFYSLESDTFHDLDLAKLLGEFSTWVAFTTELLYLRKQTKETLKSSDDFTAMLLHEIRNPLTCLQINNQIMNQNFDHKALQHFSTEKIQSLLKSSEVTIGKISKITENMQSIANIKHGKINLDPEEFTLSDLIEDVVDRHHQDAEKADCSIEWSSPTPLKVYWDRLRIEQILNNILENAIKYGTGKPIRIEAVPQGEKVKISITDHGIGIDYENLAKIFGRYERGSSFKGKSPGFGLGLYIAQQFAKAHGGAISVESTPGKGSTFFIELPCTL